MKSKISFLAVTYIIVVIMNGCTTNDKKMKKESKGDFENNLTPQEVDNARLTPEILWKFGRVDDIHPSPDGSSILFTITRYDAKTDKSHTWIYRVNPGGGDPVNLTEGFATCSTPRWMNNHTIAFLSKENDKNQIWKMNADGSGKVRISNIEGGVGGFGLAPQGNKLFYTKDVKMDQTTQDKYPDLQLAKGMIIDDLMYRHWDSWQDYTYSHIFIAGINDKGISGDTDIMKSEPYDSPLSPYFELNDIAWSPDGSKLAYTCKKLKGREYAVSTNSDIYIYDLSSQSTTNITKGMEGYDRYPVFSPDGSMLAFMSMETPGYESDKERLSVYSFQDGSLHYLTEHFDQNAVPYTWSPDGNKIYFICGTKATYQIYEIDMLSREIRQITNGMHDYTAMALGGDALVGIKSTMSMALEIFRIDPENGSEVQLTFTNQNIYDAVHMGKVEERWVKTTDGKNMLVWVIFPPDFDPDKKYPALLYCQGGPQIAISQQFSYRWNFQLMAANDYIVVAPNRRGLPTFGTEWNEQISGDWGGQNMDDYLTAIDSIKQEPYVDETRLGAVGASYGGYSVMYLAGHHNMRFKVFIAHCGIYNLESASAATEEMFFVNHDLGGYPWERPEPRSYTQFSPHLFVDRWDTPIMLVTGANDFRIPYSESLQAFNAAQMMGIPSKLLYFPDESHWVTKPQNSILWQREFFGWLDQWLKS